MRFIQKAILSILCLSLLAVCVNAQNSSIRNERLNKAEIENIIKKATKNEDDFRFALTNYVFNRSATVQTIGLGNLITGTFRRDSYMTFSSDGRRFEKIQYEPPATLKGLSITAADLEDLGGVTPFAINPQDVSNYTFDYIGKEKIDELDLYVFDVRPKVVPKFKLNEKRWFKGRIWIDDRDFMIVKSKGKGVPEDDNNKFPVVETWRINVDGKYWFPAYSYADDELVFGDGNVVRMRMRVKYDDYKQGRSEVKILDDTTEIVDDDIPLTDSGDNSDSGAKPKPTPSPNP